MIRGEQKQTVDFIIKEDIFPTSQKTTIGWLNGFLVQILLVLKVQNLHR